MADGSSLDDSLEKQLGLGRPVHGSSGERRVWSLVVRLSGWVGRTVQYCCAREYVSLGCWRRGVRPSSLGVGGLMVDRVVCMRGIYGWCLVSRCNYAVPRVSIVVGVSSPCWMIRGLGSWLIAY